MKIAGIIPARYSSSRFPGKPLIDISGKPMIQRVYEQASKCEFLAEVIVATDDERIFRRVKDFGGNVVITSLLHNSGTERCREVLESLDDTFEGVINIQGDEPFIAPEQIEQIAKLLSVKGTQIATLIKKIKTHNELFDPNVVKVVTNRSGIALYFSRNPIPFYRGAKELNWPKNHEYFKHIGIYGYKKEVLRQITDLPVAPPEKAEALEQLRWIWNGYNILTGITELESISIDIPSDLLKITNKT